MTGILNILAGSISSAIKDGYFNLVSLLLPGNGTNGAQNNTFLDSSSNNFTITRNGNTTQGTFSPFSQTGWSNYFDATTTRLGLASSIGNLGSSCAVEFWFNPSTTSGQVIVGGAGSGALQFAWKSSTEFGVGATGVAWRLTSTTIPTLNAWNHCVFVRSGTGANQASLYINGTRVANGQVSDAWNSNTALYVGSAPDNSSNITGYISNLRIVSSGTLPYDPTATSITVPTAPLTAVTGTTLLTCQSNRFIDNSSGATTITVTGSPSVQAFSPFAPTAAYSAATNGGSGYFDGTGDYLTVADNAALELGSSDFTIEWWQYNTSSASSSPLSKDAPTGTRAWGITVINDGTLTFYIPGGSQVITSTTGTWKVNAWNFFTITRSGSTIYLSINGTVQSFSWTSTIPNTADNIYIGAQNGPGSISSYVTGYLAGIRLVVGESVSTYRANFTVPTVPPTTTSNSVTAANTKLLTNFTNAGIFDATAKNDLETVGNASISTTQSKFGGSSMYFDGTGDYLSSPSSQNYAFGTGDFTIEFWVYSNDVSTANKGMIQTSTATGGLSTTFTNGVFIAFGQGSTAGTGNNGGVYARINNNHLGGNSAAATGAWYHIALTRASGTARLFVNGTQIATISNSSDVTATNLAVGGYYDTNQLLNGYIDDLRITKGYARYTANFSVPTAAFALQ